MEQMEQIDEFGKCRMVKIKKKKKCMKLLEIGFEKLCESGFASRTINPER